MTNVAAEQRPPPVRDGAASGKKRVLPRKMPEYRTFAAR